jgi:hypothetical protein
MSGQKSTSFTMHRRDATYKNLYVDNLKSKKLQVTDDISMCPVVIGENASVVSGMSIGCNAVSASNSTAVGNNAQATNNNSTAVGNDAQATNNNSTAVGQGAQALEQYSVVVGSSSRAGDRSIAIGSSTYADAPNSTAVGQNAQVGTNVTTQNSTAVGQNAQAGVALNTYNSTAVGQNAWAGFLTNTHDSTAIGADSKALSAYSTSLGASTQVQNTGGNGIALGYGAIVQSLPTALGSTNSYLAIGSAAAQVLVNSTANFTPTTDRLIVRLNNNQLYGIVLQKLNP